LCPHENAHPPTRAPTHKTHTSPLFYARAYKIYAFVTNCSGDLKERIAAVIAESPAVVALVEKVAANPGIAAWEAGRAARGEAF
jgi:hypothetical protein